MRRRLRIRTGRYRISAARFGLLAALILLAAARPQPQAHAALTPTAARPHAPRSRERYAVEPEQCAADCYVDALGGDDANGGASPANAKKTIQAAVNQVAAGGTVHVAAGTYAEQVTANKRLALRGTSGAALTRIQAPPTLPAAVSPSSTIIMIAGDGVDVDLSGFTVAGPGPGGCGSIMSGIFIGGGASATIRDNRIVDIRDEPFSGCQNGIGILVGRQSIGSAGSATIAGNLIAGYQKGGIVVGHGGSRATIAYNTITGAGAQPSLAQNGVQISLGASATVTGNTISGHLCEHARCGPNLLTAVQATGVLVFGAGAHTLISGNSISNNDIGALNDANGDPLTIDGNTLAGNRYAGIYLGQGSAVVSNNAISDGNIGVVAASFLGDSANAQGILTNNSIAGTSRGVQLLDAGPLDGLFPTVAAQLNSIAGNTIGFDNPTLNAVDASKNWWGAPSGPAPRGAGDPISAHVTVNSWICAGADTSPAIGYQPDQNAICGGTAPNTTITARPTNPSGVSATFSFTGTDDVTPPASLRFECRFDGGSFAPCAGQQLYTDLVSGTHTFAVRAIDPQGSRDPSPATFTWTVDGTSPAVVSIVRANLSPTSAASVRFIATFSQSVSGVDLTDFVLTSSGLTGAAITGAGGGGTTWTVTVSTGTGDGSPSLRLPDDDSIANNLGNRLGGAGPGNGDFRAGESYSVDKTAPTADIVDVAPDPRTGGVDSITITFSEPVTRPSPDDLRLLRNGSPITLTGILISGEGASYTLEGLAWLTSAEGDYVLTLAAAGSDIRDAAANRLAADATESFSVRRPIRPPTIASAPAGTTIRSGQQATLSVVATGTGPFTYQWYEGASGDTNRPVAGATSSSFTTPVLRGTASYWVRVANPAGYADSPAATVVVWYAVELPLVMR